MSHGYVYTIHHAYVNFGNADIDLIQDTKSTLLLLVALVSLLPQHDYRSSQ